MRSSNLLIPPQQENPDLTGSSSLSIRSWDEDGTQVAADNSSEPTLVHDFEHKHDLAATKRFAAASLFCSAEVLDTTNERRRKTSTERRSEKRLLYPSTIGVALVFLFAIWCQIRATPPPAVPFISPPLDNLLDEFLDKFVTAKDPSCFINHISFIAKTPEARCAMESFQELINKAEKWRHAAKSGFVAAGADLNGLKQTTSESFPHRWETLLMQAALTCYNLPHLEEDAGFCPHVPLHCGTYVYKEAENRVVLTPPAADKDRKQFFENAQQVLEANAAKVNLWVEEMQQELQKLATAKTERVRGMCPSALREKEKLELKELCEALAFYEQLKIYAEKRTPPPLTEGPSAAVNPKAADLYTLRAGNAASKALSVLTPNAASGSIKKLEDPLPIPTNRYIPAWLPHLLLFRHKEPYLSCVALRLHVVATGLPAFAVMDKTCLLEFVELLNQTMKYEVEKKRVELLDVNSIERRRLGRHLSLMEMQADLAAATAMLQIYKKELAAARKRKDTPMGKLKALRSALVVAYGGQGGLAADWMEKAKNGEMFLSRSDSEKLAAALQHVVNGAMLSRKLVLLQDGSAEEASIQQDEHIMTDLLSACQAHLAKATKGPLHNKEILPAWFAHIV